MSKYELSLSTNYVQDWTVVDAIRELFQNALDQQTVDSSNNMFFNYDADAAILQIGNAKSVLDPATLLLGASTKTADVSTIGQFGEGYKIAALVLLRLGKSITFYNFGRREVWTTRLVNSRKYNAKVLTFFVEKCAFWEKTPDNDLTIEVTDITSDEYTLIAKSNLHLQKDIGEFLETEFGDILKNEELRGKVFVNGLFVCDYNKYDYGYNFKPAHLKLDRDRKLVDNFSLQWLSSKMWGAVKGPDAIDLIVKGKADAEYIAYHGINELSNDAHHRFYNDNCDNCVPVSNNDELAAVPTTHKAVLVPESYRSLITKSILYTAPPVLERVVPETVEEWLAYYGPFPDGAADELLQIFKEAKWL